MDVKQVRFSLSTCSLEAAKAVYRAFRTHFSIFLLTDKHTDRQMDQIA